MKPNSNKKIRFGLIGCGVISKTHFSSLKDLPGAELVAVCDIKKDRAEKAGAENKVAFYTDYREMLKCDDIDVVSICTPHYLHFKMGVDTAISEKNALIEKPLAFNIREIDKMIEVFKKNKKEVFAVLQVRHNPPVKAIKEMIEKGRLGKIVNAALVVRWFRPQSYFDNDDWRGSKKKEGGLLFSQGVHYIDIIRWFFGPVEYVFGKAGTFGHKIQTDDIVTALINFKNGVFCTIEVSLNTYPRNLECSLTILGTKGTIKIAGSALNEIAYWEVENLDQPKLDPCLPPNIYAGGLYQGSCPNHIFIYNDIIEHLKNKDHYAIDGSESRKGLEVSEAIYKSAREGRKIKLPL